MCKLRIRPSLDGLVLVPQPLLIQSFLHSSLDMVSEQVHLPLAAPGARSQPVCGPLAAPAARAPPSSSPLAALLLPCLRRPAATTARATAAASARAARGGQRRSLPLPDDPTPQQLREWILQRARPGGGGFGFLQTTLSRQQSQQETFSPQVLSELFPQQCVTGSVEAAAPGASESAAALGFSESAAALGARESSAALGARASLATGPSSAEALHTFTLDSGTSRCFFCDCTSLTPLVAPVSVSLADPTGGPVVARASTVLPCPAVSSGSLSGLHLSTFLTNLRVAICTCSLTGRHLATFTRRPGSSLYTLTTASAQVAASGQVAASSQVSASGQLVASCSCRVLSHQTLLWHHRLGHPSLSCLHGMHSCLLECYFLLVFDNYTRYTTVFPLRRKADVSGVLIPWIHGTRLQLCERFSREFPVLRLHSNRGGEISSDLLAEFCQDEGIVQSFTLLASPQQNGIAERRTGLIMEVARTSMIHATAPHFLWPFAVRYAAHQLNLWPRVSEPETSPILQWTRKVGDASVFRVWGAISFVRDNKANKLSSRTLRSVFLDFPTDAPLWQIYHPRSRRVFPSLDVTFDESDCYFSLHPHASHPGPAPSCVSQVDQPPLVECLEVSYESSGPAEEGDPAADDTAATRCSPRLETPPGFLPRPSSPPPQPTAMDSGAEVAGVEPGGAETEGEGSRGAATRGATTGGASSWGATTGGADSGGPVRPSGGGAVGDPIGGPGAGQPPQPDLFETLSPQAIPAWIVRRGNPGGGGYGPAGAGAAGPRGARTGGARTARAGGAVRAGGATGAAGSVGTGGTAGAGGTGGTRGAGAAGPGGARTRGTGAAGVGGAAGAGGAGGATGATCTGGAGGTTGARGPGATGASGAAGAAGARGAGGAAGAVGARGAGATGAGGAGAAGTALLPSSTGLPLPLLCPPTDQSQPQLLPGSPLPAPAPHTKVSESLTERREPETRASTPIRARRVARPRHHAVPGTHGMALRPSSVPQRVVLPEYPASSVPHVPDPESDLARAANPTVNRLLANVVTDPDLESTAGFALVTELVGFGARSRLSYVASLIPASESVCPPFVKGELALGSDVLEDRQFELECLAAALPRFASMLFCPEGDSDTLDNPTPHSYAKAIVGEYSSQWQTAMDAEKASWKSTGTYVDEVPPRGANIVDGMWIFIVKQPPGSPPAFKARYVARGFNQRQGVNFFQTFSPTPKMTTLQVLLHIAAQRDYELHSLDFSTAFLQGSLHEEIWLRRPPSFTVSFPAGTQWSLRRPVHGLGQAPREWHDTLRTTLAALGFAPSSADPSLFLRTDTTLPPFYVLVYVDDLVFATTDTEALALVKAELQERHTCTNLGELRSYLGLQVTQDRARRTITLTQSHMVHQVLQLFAFQFSSPQPTSLSTGHSLSAPPSDESVEPSGPYPELVGCLITSGMGLVLGGQGSVVLSGHSDASWADNQATQRSSQGYTFSLGSDSVSWRSTCSSCVLSSSYEAEIYAGAMAPKELRWLTYLLTDLGEQPRSP
ncbi:unnamed protein product [Closterium sp. NIES-54]